MRKDVFIKELEYLLQDIPDEDKADAIAYYQDYLEEAGPENEEKVIQDFGSPERIAAIIRADISGNLKDGGEFTEKGYEDERFREPNFQLVKRQDVYTGKPLTGQERAKWEWWQILGMIVLGCCIIPVAVPLIFGLGGGAVGLLLGIGSLLAAVLAAVSIGLAAVTLVLLIGGILLIIVSFGQMSVDMVQGILCLGTGCGFRGSADRFGLWNGECCPCTGRTMGQDAVMGRQHTLSEKPFCLFCAGWRRPGKKTG